MFIIKDNYYLYIENTRDIDLNIIKFNKKISIIYRNYLSVEPLSKVKNFRRICLKKNISFYVANNIKLANKCRADGIYLSSNNKNMYLNKNFDKIGSAHNFKEISAKIKQGCKTIILSRLFKTNYKNKKSFLGIIKFNLAIKNTNINLVPLGGIRLSNLNMLNLVNTNGIALLSEIKKKPTKIISRLF